MISTTLRAQSIPLLVYQKIQKYQDELKGDFMRFEHRMSQQQKQTQKLAMTQQLTQSIQMLQYNAEDLLSFLENKSLENPLLAIDSGEYDAPYESRKNQHYDASDTDWMSQIPDEEESLFEYLIDQIHLNYRETKLRQWVLFLTEYIDVNGYLTVDLNEAARLTGATDIEMLDALTLLQMLEPAGVGARDLRECLMLQTERDEQAPNLAYLILEEMFEELAERKWTLIEKKYDIPLYDIQEIFDYLKTLSPNPGARFGSNQEQYIHPEIIVKVTEETIEVLSTKRTQPNITFHQHYFDKMNQTGDKEVEAYLKEKKQEFDWIKKGVEQRGDTILKVATEIVHKQQDFFLDESRPLKPMQLKEISSSLNIHESTVSRSINGKFLETTFGVFELRSFFTTGMEVKGEEEVSTSTIKQAIQGIVDQEDKAKPLSDQKILEALKEQKFEISRRTVAKYREALAIPSSAKRKRYDKK